MCGIAGILQFKNPIISPEKKLKAMVSQLYHRGPDECGFYFSQNVAFGMSRLSIIDLSHGSQPISNENESIWVVFNGEIFNYKELREELKKLGHKFKTQSDTEVIVHSYEQWAEKFVNHLNGQFAICIYDGSKKQLLLLRDRVGIRPLFYSYKNGKLIFASEIKSILAEATTKAMPNFKALLDIFTFWTTIPSGTIFQDIYELPPGYGLIANQNGIRLFQYWDLPFDRESYLNKDKQTIRQELFDLLKDAVSIRLRADVPVGAYLSGGLDSSIITSLVNEIHQNRLKTFSVNFKDQSYDEAYFQQLLIQQLNTEHRSLVVDGTDIFSQFYKVIWFSEKPILRTAPAPLLALSSLVNKDNFKVVLTGEGADEFFAGYNIFKENRVRRFWAREPDSNLRPLLLSRIYPYILNQQGTLNPFWQAFFKRRLLEFDNPVYSHLLRWENTSKIRFLLVNEIKEQYNFQDQIERALSYLPKISKINDPLSRAQYIEAKIFLNGYLLSSQGDRMLMGHSVEGRFPFLDHRVIEFASQIPNNWRLNGLNEKYILKETFKDILPPAIFNRPKQPYRAPISKSIFENDNLWWIHDLLSAEKIKQYGYFESSKVQLLLKKIKENQNPISQIDEMGFVGVLSTQLWHYHFIENFDANSGNLPKKQKVVKENMVKRR